MPGLKGEEDRVELLELYGRIRAGKRIPDEEGSPAAGALRLSGIVSIRGRFSRLSPLSSPLLVVRNRIYARVFDRAWVARHMPGAELRRQEAAFRRGVLRAGAVAGVVISVVGGLAAAASSSEARSRRLAAQRGQMAGELQIALDEEKEARGNEQKALAQLRETVRKLDREQRYASHQARRAEKAAGQERAARGRADTASREANVQRKRAVSNQKESDRRLLRLVVERGAQQAETGDRLGSLLWFAEGLRLDAGSPEREAAHRLRIASVLRQSPRLLHLWALDAPATHLFFSPGGRRLAARDTGGLLRIWDAFSGATLLPPVHCGEGLGPEAFSPDGRRILVADGRMVRVWDLEIGKQAAPPATLPADAAAARFSPAGDRAVLGDRSGAVYLWDTRAGSGIRRLEMGQGPCVGVHFSPNGRRLLTVHPAGAARVWDLETGKEVLTPLQMGRVPESVAFSPDGRWIVTVGSGQTRFWDAASGGRTGTLIGLPPNQRIRFSPDGSRLLTSGGRHAQLWDPATASPASSDLEHERGLTCAGFSEDGRRLLTGDTSGTLRVWDMNGRRIGAPIRLPGPLGLTAFGRESRYVATVTEGHVVRLWDAAGAGVPDAEAHPGAPAALSNFTRDGSRMIAPGADGAARLLSTETGAPVGPTFPHGRPIERAAVSPDGRHVATAGGNLLRLWDAHTGTRERKLTLQAGVDDLLFSPDSRSLVVRQGSSPAAVVDVRTGGSLSIPKRFHPYGIFAFSPDGRFILTQVGWGPLLVQRLRNERILQGLVVRGAIASATFSPDNRRLVAGEGDGTLRLYDMESGKPVGRAQNQGTRPWCVRFSPDGRRIATGGADGSLRLWSAAGWKPLLPPLRHAAGVLHLAFSPDGRLLATVTGEGEVQVWDSYSGEPVTLPLRAVGPGRVEFSRDGRRLLLTLYSGDLFVWRLEPDRRPVRDLVRIARVLSGAQVRTDGVPASAPAPALAAAWEELRRAYPDDFRCSLQQEEAWRRGEATDCEAAHLWSAALPHLEWLVAAHPEERSLYPRRGAARAALGRCDEAARDFAEAKRRGLDDEMVCYHLALAQLASGDREGYRRTCAEMLSRFQEAPEAHPLDLTAWTCVLAPDATADPEHPLRLYRELITGHPDGPDASLLQTLGALCWRAGRAREAVDHLQEAMKLRGRDDDPLDQLLLALALHAAGEQAEARVWLDRAEAQVASLLRKDSASGPGWDTLLECRRLLQEAQGTLGH